jgi:hypothetical protein
MVENQALHPGQIALTYWYATDPQNPRTINYSKEKHSQTWIEILSLLDEIDSCLEGGEWSLTDNWSHCHSCTYGTYCDRWETGSPLKMIAEDEIEYEFDALFQFEPDTP